MSEQSYPERLDKLAKLVEAHIDRGKNGNEREDDDESFKDLLKRVIAVVREADANAAPNLTEVVNKAGDILDRTIDWAYGDGQFDFLPSFAHDPDVPPSQDSLSSVGVGFGGATELLKLLQSFLGRGGGDPLPQRARDKLFPSPWTKSHPPHAKSTRLSRFRDNVTLPSTDATPLAHSIYQARCEIASDNFPCPVGSAIGSDGSALAVIGQGGWKHRDPVLTIYLLDEGSGGPRGERGHFDVGEEGGERNGGRDKGGAETFTQRHYRTIVLEPGLSEVASEVAVNAANKLVLVADRYRVKSFFYGRVGEATFGGWTTSRGQNVHTLDSRKFDGPLAVLPDGRIARGGKGSVALWNVATLATHKGGRRVGKGKFNVESWRDNEFDEIEQSIGSAPTTVVKFPTGEEGFAPASWQFHEPTGHMLVGENARKTPGRYGCYAIDLEDSGKKVKRFLGHGGFVETFSVSAGDANVFATGCSDGFARLFDVRHPLPAITFNSGNQSEFCSTVQLIHPDGIPTIFTGGHRSQSIKCWDVRARKMVYELATGNNSVSALSWDTKRSVLYAATECDNMDRLGYHHEYRPATTPPWAERHPDEHDGNSGGLHNWPKNAYHSEAFFGYAFDAGEQTLLRYQFKENPDPLEIPEYGQATLDGDNYW